jgi:MurNAc alpha-1-phosphate uridylyltransferase
MILAAGRGERMRELTAALPKPLLDVGGSSLIERHVAALARTGIKEIVVNLSYGGEQIRSALMDGHRWRVSIAYSDEGSTALETGGGIIEALPLLGEEPFLVVNADVVTDFDFVRLEKIRGDGTLVMVPNPEHHPAGDFGLSASGLISASPPCLTYAGMAVFDPVLFHGWARGRRPLRPMLEAAIARGALYGVRHSGLWLDVGTPERLFEARRLVLAAARHSSEE